MKAIVIFNPVTGGAGDRETLAKQLRGRLGAAHLSSHAIIFRRAAKISIRSKPGMWFNARGELVGNEPAAFQVIPRALHFVVDKK